MTVSRRLSLTYRAAITGLERALEARDAYTWQHSLRVRSYALRLAEVAALQGIDLVQGPIRTTVHAGEPGASIPETRRRIQEAFGARTFDHVGIGERAMITLADRTSSLLVGAQGV